MNLYFQRVRLAGILCRIAAWIRGEKWYVSESWASCTGNRANDLVRQIEEDIMLGDKYGSEETLAVVNPKLKELSQLAEQKWTLP